MRGLAVCLLLLLLLGFAAWCVAIEAEESLVFRASTPEKAEVTAEPGQKANPLSPIPGSRAFADSPRARPHRTLAWPALDVAFTSVARDRPAELKPMAVEASALLRSAPRRAAVALSASPAEANVLAPLPISESLLFSAGANRELFVASQPGTSTLKDVQVLRPLTRG
jgi:hypothetical protein